MTLCGFLYTQASAESLQKHAEREREPDEAAGSAQVRLHACVALLEAFLQACLQVIVCFRFICSWQIPDIR